MKLAVEQHKQHLKNQIRHRQQKREEQERLIGEINRCGQSIDLLTQQIAEADRRGITAFDPERFLIPRTKKTQISDSD
jgi:hypothetical protein